MPRLLTGARVRATTVAALLLLAIALPPTAAVADTVDDTGGVAWTVQTAENEHGTGRPNFTYDVEPGQVIADSMVVTNTGTVPLPLEVYAADAFTTMSGNIDLLQAGDASVDAGAWVTPSVTSLTLAPGEAAAVAFTIAVPADAAPGDHAAGLLTSLTSQDSGLSLEVDRRLGTRINLRVAGDLVPAADVTVVSAEAIPSLNPIAPTTLRLTYRIENTGNTRVTGAEIVEAHTLAGLLGTTRIQPQLPEILPRSTIQVVRDVPVTSLGWVGGTLTVAAEGVGLGAGDIEPVTAEFGAVAIPWSLLAVVILAAAAAIGILLWVRAAQRKRTDAPGASAPAPAPADADADADADA